MKYGPNTETVEAFLRHLKGLTKEQWAEREVALDAVWDAASGAAAAREAAWYAALSGRRHAAFEREAALDAALEALADVASTALDAVWDATYEILGAAIMRKRGQPFYFLPMFGFESPEAVLENDQ